MEFIANFQNVSMNGNLGLLIRSYHFIIGKGNEPTSLNQCFGLVDNQAMHARCHFPTTYV
jgi:hypothetical protein